MPTRPALLLCLLATPLAAEEVGRVGVDWAGNDSAVEALKDAEVQGVTCHASFFERPAFDRLAQRDCFDDPSNWSIACRQTGPLLIGGIARGEEIISERRSVVLKGPRAPRIFDEENRSSSAPATRARRPKGRPRCRCSRSRPGGQDVAWE